MVYLRNLFVLCCLCLLSVAKLSAQVNPVTPVQPLNSQEDIELRLMMVDALLELNDAMLQGVKASKDTLNLPENAQTIKEKDMQTTLIRMKRMRDRTLLMPYLEHIEDSIKNEIVILEKEKKMLEAALNPMKPLQPVAVKKDTLVAGKDTLVVHTTIDPTSGKPTQVLQDVISSDAIASASKADVKKQKKPKKQPNYYPMDTVLVFDMGEKMKPAPEPARTMPIARPDTAAFAKAMSDTNGIKIKLPNSEDSIVIKPVRGKKREPSVFVDSVITPQEINAPYISDVANLSADSVNKIKAAFFLQRANTAVIVKDYKTAEQYFAKAVEVHPKYFEAWLAKAELEVTMREDDKALNSYKKANEVDSNKANVHYGIAMIYQRSKKTSDALKELDKAIKLNPKHVEALMERAVIYKASKRYLESIVEYNKAVKADITHYQAYRERGLVKILVKDYDEAADDFTRFLIFEPNDAEMYYQRGMCRILTKDFEDGCSDLSTAKEKGYADAEKAMKKYCKQ